MNIRDASLDDHDRLHAIDIATYAPQNSPGPPPEPGVHSFDRYPAGRLLIAESGGHLKGYIAWGHPTSLQSSEHVMQIQALGVDPQDANRGVGRALVDAITDLARHREATKLSLRVLGPNVIARRLYAKAGFVVEGVLREEFMLNGRPTDDILMAHYLAE